LIDLDSLRAPETVAAAAGSLNDPLEDDRAAVDLGPVRLLARVVDVNADLRLLRVALDEVVQVLAALCIFGASAWDQKNSIQETPSLLPNPILRK
jgi:hypothetical protein